jgi:hypothetical protein
MAFAQCSGLTTVTLGDRLEEIGERAFGYCKLLEHIVIPHAVMTIKKRAYRECSGLTTVTLGDGLEEIGEEAFRQYTSLGRIVIPPTVKTIDDTAFDGCSNLTSVEFCDKIEEFMYWKAMRGWWDRGVHENSLSTYCFLDRCSIPERLGLFLVQSWRANIYGTLSRIPAISVGGLNAHFDSIDSSLTAYENLSEAPMLLGLAIPNDDIVLRVLSFL